jgi:hypothetical protein
LRLGDILGSECDGDKVQETTSEVNDTETSYTRHVRANICMGTGQHMCETGARAGHA